MTLERCRDVSDDPAMVVGENAATVGVWASRGLLDCAPLSEILDGGDMGSAQGISIEMSVRETCLLDKKASLPKAAMHKSCVFRQLPPKGHCGRRIRGELSGSECIDG